MEGLLDSERVFAENYVISLRKDLAAISAGFSKSSASAIGWQVYNRPHVKAYIEKLLDDATISAKATLKIMSDATQASMNDYMRKVKKTVVNQVKKGLQELIDQLQYEIEIEEEFLRLADNLTKEEIEASNSLIKYKSREIIRYDIELNKNPNAYRIVDSDPEIVEVIELDLEALAADKERGRIKSYKVTKDGIQVELQPPEVAREMAKIHGLYEKDNDQKKTVIAINIDDTDAKLGE